MELGLAYKCDVCRIGSKMQVQLSFVLFFLVYGRLCSGRLTPLQCLSLTLIWRMKRRYSRPKLY